MQEKISESKRNSTVDILRGMAMLMVVLGHTMTACTNNSQQSFLYNIVWSLQMPLFILISGYVTKYSKPVQTTKEFLNFVKRRTIAYLLPWVMWTFVVRGLIFGQTNYFDMKQLLWNMDIGYWFLFTIWTINLVFGVSNFLCRKVLKGAKNTPKIKAIVFTGVFYVIGMAVLAGIGMVAGMSFLCIKLTLYYMPFFFVGYIYGNLQDDIYALQRGRQIVDCVIVAALVIWLSVITRVNLYDLADSGLGIILRAGASLCGCVAVCGLCAGLFGNAGKYRGGGIPLVRSTLAGDIHSPLSASLYDTDEYKAGILEHSGNRPNSSELCTDSRAGGRGHSTFERECGYTQGSVRKIGRLLEWCGLHSLEIYLLHGFFLNQLKLLSVPDFGYALGLILVFINFTVTVLIVITFILIIQQASLLNFFLFGKK